MPRWGKPKKLSNETKQFLKMTRQGFGDGDWSFVAQKALTGEYVTRPMRASWLPGFLDKLKVDDACNIYTTANAFSSNKGNQAGYLFSMHHLVADVDCHAKKISDAARDIQIDNLVHVLKHGSDYGILEPSYIVHTGRGVQIWWHHEALSAQSNLWTWQSVAKRLVICLDTILANLGKDPVDGCPDLSLDKVASFNPAGYYRLPGTINQNTKQMVTVEVIHDHVFSLAELKAFRDEIPLPPVGFKPKKGTDHKMWAKNMLRKLYSLREMRDAEPGDELRNNFCFVVFCTLRTAGYGRKDAMALTEHFNEGFKSPFREGELKACLSSAVRKHYKLSTKAIIEFLDITQEEREALGIGVNLEKLERQKRARERQETLAARNAKIIELYLTQQYSMRELGKMFGVQKAAISLIIHPTGINFRAENAKERDAQIVKLFDKGWTYDEIACEIGCGRATVQRALRRYKDAKQAAEMEARFEAVPEKNSEEEPEGIFLAEKNPAFLGQDNYGCLVGPRAPAPQAEVTCPSPAWVYGSTPLPAPASGERWSVRSDGWGTPPSLPAQPSRPQRSTPRGAIAAAPRPACLPAASCWPAHGTAEYMLLQQWYHGRGDSVPCPPQFAA